MKIYILYLNIKIIKPISNGFTAIILLLTNYQMKLILVGYGKMGKVIHNLAEGRGHKIVNIIEIGDKLTDIVGEDFDVLIDFTSPESALENIEFYAKHNIKAIIGTTGWYDHIDKVKKIYQHSKGAILWASNFSIGVNIFWNIVRKASQIMNHFDEYDVFGHEFHHNMKADSPSGTAISTANIVLEHIDRKSTLITNDLQRKINPEELHFSSTRGGSINGIHSVYFDSPFDSIEITHSAKNRNGFALGAILGAEWIYNKNGYFEIDDMMKNLLNK